jgi:glycosyltransferase involved in cell wall biosynthesis
MKEKHSHPLIRLRKELPLEKLKPKRKPVKKNRLPRLWPKKPKPVEKKPEPKPGPKPVSKPEPLPTPKRARKRKPRVNVSNQITTIVVSFNTEHLLRDCLTTFNQFYPDVPLIVVDNASQDGSAQFAQEFAAEREKTTVVVNETNRGHGPAMHQAIIQTETPYFFTLDTDCIVNLGGFLQAMLTQLKASDLYATGWLRWVNRTGVATRKQVVSEEAKKSLTPYIHPCAALFDRQKYLTLPPFSHTGSPCTTNFWEARARGYRVEAFPIFEYVTHLVAGTRRLYGGRWNPKDDEEPNEWNERAQYAI